jgi:hypothetical protein
MARSHGGFSAKTNRWPNDCHAGGRRSFREKLAVADRPTKVKRLFVIVMALFLPTAGMECGYLVDRIAPTIESCAPIQAAYFFR